MREDLHLDHNKERAIEHIDEFMSDPEAAKEVGGFAYHWYSGDHFEALSMLRGKYPDKVLMHSESCGLHIPGKVTMLDMTDEQIERCPMATTRPWCRRPLRTRWTSMMRRPMPTTSSAT